MENLYPSRTAWAIGRVKFASKIKRFEGITTLNFRNATLKLKRKKEKKRKRNHKTVENE